MAEVREYTVSEPPRGWRRLLALGPGLVWSASAVGVGSLVFATRAGKFAIVMTYSSAVFFIFFIVLLLVAVLQGISFSL